ncbi:MAG: ABC transporter permease [Saprospiraceae bacterium]|nr:ABC transporter permease [Saprospiraceae bacterium]
MFYNYIKTGWRSFSRGGLYSAINLIGLSLGTAVVILLSSFIKDEWTFDNFHPDTDRIYRVWVKEYVDGDIFFNTVTPFIIGPQLEAHLPEIEAMSRYATNTSPIRLNENTSSGVVFLADSSFIDIFHFPVIRGEAGSFHSDPFSILISNRTARKYFGPKDPIGQTLEIQMDGQWIGFQVKGVTEDPPSNSGFQFDILMPMENADRLFSSQAQNSWTNVYVETFIKLDQQNNLAGLEQKVVPFIDNQVEDIYEPGEYEVGFQPLSDIHLNNDFPVGILPVSDGRYPFILAAVAVLILILAGINFTTIAIGRSLKRAREVGVRKTSGATKWQLMLQFWSEAILTTLVSVLLGLGIAYLLLPTFNRLAEKSLTLPLTFYNLLFLIVLTLLIGFFAGIYPSLVLAKVNPVQSLRGIVDGSQIPKNLILRSLIGFQFSLSVILICCTLIMKKQINYLQNANLGFAKDQIVSIPYSKPGTRLSQVMEEANQKARLMENQLMPGGDISEVTISNHSFGSPGWTTLGFTDKNTQSFQSFNANGIDEKFIPIYEINILEGRNFEKDNLADKKSVIVNEAFSKQFKIKLNENLPEPFQEFRVIGITDDFKYQSLHQEVEPLVLSADPIPLIQAASDVMFADSPTPKLSMRITEDVAGSLLGIETVWKSITELPFDFYFVDERVDRQYQAEHKLGVVITMATILAILIACLGLFGMITLMVARKSREIAIRKVLGADVFNIVVYFNQKFTLLIAIACLIAIPLSLFVMNKWLEDFAYRINPPWWLFVLAAFIAFLLAGLTISFQSIRAALVNPVKSIHAE